MGDSHCEVFKVRVSKETLTRVEVYDRVEADALIDSLLAENARLKEALQSKSLPEGWKARRIRAVLEGNAQGFIISSPRTNGVSTSTGIFADSKDVAHRMLYEILATSQRQLEGRDEPRHDE